MSRRKIDAANAPRQPMGLKSWLRKLFDDPVAFFTALAGVAAAVSAIFSFIVTNAAREDQRLNNAPALYLDCKSVPGHTSFASTDLYYHVFDPQDYPGAVNENVRSEIACKLTNISGRSAVNIRIGFLALFYDAKKGANQQIHFRDVILPDDALYFSYGDRTETLNLASHATATFILPNGAPENMILVPAAQAEVQFPGDSSVRCADVYTAPGTLFSMRAEPMPALPTSQRKNPAPSIPSPGASNCIVLDASRVLQQRANLAGKPDVFIQGTIRRKGQSVILQLPNF